MKTIVSIASLCLLAAMASCGSDGTPATAPLDCAWLASESNCWRRAVDQIEQCIPQDGPPGAFSEDRRSCVYEDGTTLEFTEPAESRADVAFTVQKDGAVCMEFSRTPGPQANTETVFIQRGDESVRYEVFSGECEGCLGARMECSDGQRVALTDAFELLSCDLDHLPRFTTQSAIFGLDVNGGTRKQTILIACE